jgi:hypothetical protein
MNVRMNVHADLTSALDQVVTYGAISISVTAGLLAVFTLKPPKQRKQVAEVDEDGFKWAVMGVVGCLPLFNWLVSSLVPEHRAAMCMDSWRGTAPCKDCRMDGSVCTRLTLPWMHAGMGAGCAGE